jgi:hypothetical protein
MSRPTAVEYLIMVLRVNAGIRVSKQLQEEVLQMEKQMTIEAFEDGTEQSFICKTGEEYYNETYKNENK